MYTHDFEIKVDGIIIEGEIKFNGNEASFKTTSGEEMTVRQHGQFQKVLEALCKFDENCADIDKVEIVKK